MLYLFQKQATADFLNPLSSNPTKWSNTLKRFVGNLPTNCLSVFGHFVGLALKKLKLITERRIFDHGNIHHRTQKFKKMGRGPYIKYPSKPICTCLLCDIAALKKLMK